MSASTGQAMAIEGGVVVVTGDARGLAQQIVVGTHRIAADEPTSAGGTDSGPNPYDLLLAALGSCTSMTVTLYARRKQWPLQRDVVFAGPLSDEQRSRLLEIANRCPVHRTLTSEIDIRTRLVAEGQA